VVAPTPRSSHRPAPDPPCAAAAAAAQAAKALLEREAAAALAALPVHVVMSRADRVTSFEAAEAFVAGLRAAGNPAATLEALPGARGRARREGGSGDVLRTAPSPAPRPLTRRAGPGPRLPAPPQALATISCRAPTAPPTPPASPPSSTRSCRRRPEDRAALCCLLP
jgi:hypothetical protein